MAEPAQQGLPQDKIVDQPKPEAMQMKQGDGVDAVNALAWRCKRIQTSDPKHA